MRPCPPLVRGRWSNAKLCRREGISQGIYYKWSKDLMEAGKTLQSLEDTLRRFSLLNNLLNTELPSNCKITIIHMVWRFMAEGMTRSAIRLFWQFGSSLDATKIPEILRKVSAPLPMGIAPPRRI